MIIIFTIVMVLLSAAAFFLWTLIHELSHYIMAKMLVDANLIEIKPYPHVHPKYGFYFGAIWFDFKTKPTNNQYAAIMFAPRLLNLLAVVALPFAFTFTNYWYFTIWTILWGAGVIDLINGSIGRLETSDLKRGAEYLKESPWIFRVMGFVIAITTIMMWGILSVSNFIVWFK